MQKTFVLSVSSSVRELLLFLARLILWHGRECRSVVVVQWDSKKLLKYMRSHVYRPLDRKELARHLKIINTAREGFYLLLQQLREQGLIEEIKGGRLVAVKMVIAAKTSAKSKSQIPANQQGTAIKHASNPALRRDSSMVPTEISGQMRFFASGSVWLYLPEPMTIGSEQVDRLRVAPEHCGTALDGDEVCAKLLRTHGNQKSRRGEESETPFARVTRVKQRRSGRVVGRVQRAARQTWVELEDVALSGQLVLDRETTAETGQRVVVELSEWTDEREMPTGKVIEVLGWPGEPEGDIRAIMHRYGLNPNFSSAVLREVEEVAEKPMAEELARREDWRERLVITIDPATAKDHDDAIWVEKTPNGWTLAVHIADVAHYIRVDSALDAEARRRGNSTYLVDRVIPMLPAELSNGICSLHEGVDRLTKCALLDVDQRGNVVGARFFDAVMHCQKQLSYEEAQDMLDAPRAGDDVAAMVREAWAMASTMRLRRFQRGALDLEFPEHQIHLNEQGLADRVSLVTHGPSHQLIEECMLAANEAVALRLKQKSRPTIYRVHDEPDEARLAQFASTLAAFGLPDMSLLHREKVQELLRWMAGRPEEPLLKLGLLKSFKRAAYSIEPRGHYGLAKLDYCHFTSPIRRYADLLVHRSLETCLANPSGQRSVLPKREDMVQIAAHLSQTERVSAEAENESKQCRLLQWLEKTALQAEAPEWLGLVIEVRAIGLMVDVPLLGMKGVCKRDDARAGEQSGVFTTRNWHFDSERNIYQCSDGSMIRAGQTVKLRVKSVDAIKKFLDFSMVSLPEKSQLGRGVERARRQSQQVHEKPMQRAKTSQDRNRKVAKPKQLDDKAHSKRSKKRSS